MEALKFITRFNKEYLIKSKINNNIYNKQNNNYKYYYNKFY